MHSDFDLETDRLRLRWLRRDDAGLMLDIWNDPAFIRGVGDRGIRSLAAAIDAMERNVFSLYARYGYGPYRVSLKNSDEAIGVCGLFRREGLDTPDIGYAILPRYCDRGFAYEAAVAVVDYARSELKVTRLIAIIAPHNHASIRLIRKLGLCFERMHVLQNEKSEVCVYALELNN